MARSLFIKNLMLGNQKVSGASTANYLTVMGNLIVGATNVLTELSAKATTANLNFKTDKSTTNNLAVAWSSGSASADHYLKTGTESLIVSTPNNTAAMETTETSLGLANEGKTQFYKDVSISAACIPNSIQCVDTATIGGALIVSGARLNVSQAIQNNQLNGYTSLYLQTTSGTPATPENIQILSGGNTGLNICTQTAHPTKLRTYTDEAGALTSMPILANATRDVEILAPLKIKSSQTTIDNGVLIGDEMPAEAVGLFVANNSIIPGNLTVGGNSNVVGNVNFAHP
jgi:hypothetical protein